MGIRFISLIDYGPGNNDKHPRWAVYEFDSSWFGHQGNHKVAGPFWTEEEARRAMGSGASDFWRAPAWFSYLVLAILVVSLAGRYLFRWW